MTGTIRVASYNMRKAIGLDRLRDPERTISVLEELDADIVALQEADRRLGRRPSAIPPDLIASRTDFVPVDLGNPESLGWHGNALLVRKGIDVIGAEPVPLPTLEPRGAVMADLDLGGRHLRVVGMHLDLSGVRRRQQIRAVLERAGEGGRPAVLMGDLNQWSEGGCLGELAFHHFRMIRTPRSFHSRRPVARLDRIIVSHDIAVEDSGLHRTPLSVRASDHLPVWADIGLPKRGDTR